jgi:D-alanyl-lipoteichoic acid acyltransferase DltB (MBOAT superfamily)
MVFTSYDFLLFFFIIFILYWIIRERRWQNLLLLIASFYFYGFFQIWYAVLLAISTTVDFLLAHGMTKHPERKNLYLWGSLLVNIGVLAFFKYYDFFASDVITLLETLGVQIKLTTAQILLPIGLSFFTLKKMSYIFDVSRGTLKSKNSFIDFALYVSFFPQIVAGPIDRPQNLLLQFEAPRIWKVENFTQAFPLILIGFFKKLVISNSIQILVDRVFGFSQPSGLLLISGSLGYTLQILADFSAYTDLSRGLSFLLGFNTVENFRQPYLSLTPTDFWNRWHISLSTWLRDYIFFPVRRALLRYKLNEKFAMSIPPLITMFISGLWHGASPNFVVWGLYYGFLIAGYQLAGIRGDWKSSSKIKTFWAWLLMFTFIVFGWMMFRAPSLDWLFNILLHSEFIPPQNELVLALITLTATLTYSLPLFINYWIDTKAKETWLQAAFYAVCSALTVIYINSTSSDFIYFQF